MCDAYGQAHQHLVPFGNHVLDVEAQIRNAAWNTSASCLTPSGPRTSNGRPGSWRTKPGAMCSSMLGKVLVGEVLEVIAGDIVLFYRQSTLLLLAALQVFRHPNHGTGCLEQRCLHPFHSRNALYTCRLAGIYRPRWRGSSLGC